MKLSRKHLEGILISLVLGLASFVYGQSEVILQNINNTSTNSSASSNGLFWVQVGVNPPGLIQQDFNAAFYAGTNATNFP